MERRTTRVFLRIVVSVLGVGCGNSGNESLTDASSHDMDASNRQEGSTRDGAAPDSSMQDSSMRDGLGDDDGGGPPDGSSHPPDSGADSGSAPSCASMTGYTTEAFQDDFNGAALDTTAWDVVTGAAKASNGSFTQITNMVSANITVSGGLLRLTTKRQCADPFTDPTTPAHPAACSPGPNYYSGAWIEAKWTAAMMAPKGLMMFSARVPTPEPGTWPALWARNTNANGYGELDLIEQWYDSPAGVMNNPGDFSATTHFGSGTTPLWQTSNNQVGPFAGLDGAFHVWAVAWDSTVVPSTITYSWGASLATLAALKTITYETPGLSGNITSSEFTAALDDSWRPYIDIGVSPADTYHESPDSAATFDTAELDVDWVVMCKP